jgi:hypothetical protein
VEHREPAVVCTSTDFGARVFRRIRCDEMGVASLDAPEQRRGVFN